MIRLGILGSTRGTNMISIVNAIQSGRLHASIEIVISNKADALILEKAASFGLKSIYMNPAGLSRTQYDLWLSDLLKQHQVDLVVLIGYMKILSPEFIRDWPNRVINVHPSLLPAFAGMMDLDVHKAVIESHLKESGCTIHYVIEEVDAGPIVLQKKCVVDTSDSPESLKAKVQKLEGEALVEAIQQLSHL